jgi:hypothetical protein
VEAFSLGLNADMIWVEVVVTFLEDGMEILETLVLIFGVLL